MPPVHSQPNDSHAGNARQARERPKFRHDQALSEPARHRVVALAGADVAMSISVSYASPESRDVADLSSHDAFVTGVPHRTFETLRREDPVAWFEEREGSGFWAITRHTDIVAVNRSYRRFSSRQGIRLEEMSEEERVARLTMMEHDPPEHTRLRRFVNRGFARPLVETYERRVRDLVGDVLDKALIRDEFDCVTEIAKPLPLKMLASVLGVSEEDGAWLAAKGDEMIGNSDPDFTEHVVDRVDTDAFRLMPFRSPAGAEVFEYAERQAEIRRRQPRDDVISLLLEPLADGKPLGDLEFKNFFTLLIAAGNDNHALRDRLRHPRPRQPAAPVRAASRRRRAAVEHRGGGAAAHELPDHALSPYRDGGLRDARAHHRGGRQGAPVVHLRQP